MPSIDKTHTTILAGLAGRFHGRTLSRAFDTDHPDWPATTNHLKGTQP